eukprot:CAMPEP_0115679808 /NCGR_PEP_ID=MMETSP0272-20121206/56472_1 /TAXON_ID=71861 /ORGANISM="Scrippsiella trochoidea, Strain CCMP3099" /LENGTH=93 /DNA_ID=CAMNT_0003119049 /DNA_START=179 /DNA_END=457 /DNA_ORIENTATION=-
MAWGSQLCKPHHSKWHCHTQGYLRHAFADADDAAVAEEPWPPDLHLEFHRQKRLDPEIWEAAEWPDWKNWRSAPIDLEEDAAAFTPQALPQPL